MISQSVTQTWYAASLSTHRRPEKPFNTITRAKRPLEQPYTIIRVYDDLNSCFGRITFRALNSSVQDKVYIDQILTILLIDIADNMPVNVQIQAVGKAQDEEVLLLLQNIEIKAQQFMIWVPREFAPETKHLLDQNGLPRSSLLAQIPEGESRKGKNNCKLTCARRSTRV